MTFRNRRQFLEESMLAAAAAVAGTAASPLLADESQPTSSPNERLGVAVMGSRGRGGSHIGAFAGRKDTEILYICDVDEEIGESRAEQVEKKQSGRRPKFEKDIRAVLEDPAVDIVTVATPNHWHALGAIWALQAGKHVYLEKPVSHNVSEGRRIVETARKYGKICQTGTQSRSNPGMIAAIEYVQSGKIGDVRVARGLCFKPRGSIGPRGNYAPPKSVDYNLWLGPAPQAPVTRKQFHYDWHWQWPYGSGDLGNQGIHQMDLARWGLGVDALGNHVLSYGGRLNYEDAGDTANTQVVVHDYGDKTLVFEVRGLKTGPLTRSSGGVKFGDGYGPKIGVIFEGTDGFVVMTSYHSGAAFDREGNKIEEFSGGNDSYHYQNFLAAVRSGDPKDLNADILEGHLSSALCHLGNISYRLGSEVAANDVAGRISDFPSVDNNSDTVARMLEHLEENKLSLAATKIRVGQALAFNPESETFQGSDAANAMLTGEYRKPFVVPTPQQV